MDRAGFEMISATSTVICAEVAGAPIRPRYHAGWTCKVFTHSRAAAVKLTSSINKIFIYRAGEPLNITAARALGTAGGSD